MSKPSDDSVTDRIQAITEACQGALRDNFDNPLNEDGVITLFKTRDKVDELIDELEKDNGSSPELLQELTLLKAGLLKKIDRVTALREESKDNIADAQARTSNQPPPPFNPKKTDPPPLPRGGGTLHVPLGEVVGSVSVELPKGKTIRPSALNGAAGNTPIPPTEVASGIIPEQKDPKPSALVVQAIGRTSGSKDSGRGRRRRENRDRQNDDRRTRPDVSMNRATASGNPGAKGVQGEKGPKGDKGDPGRDGKDGADGYNGADGIQGPKGDRGEKGDKGDPGRDGEDGKDGATLPQWEKFVLLMLPTALAVVLSMLFGYEFGKSAAEEVLANAVAVGNPAATVSGHASVSASVEIEATTKAAVETKVTPTEEILRATVAKRAGRSYGTLACYGSLDWTEKGGDVTKEPVDCTGVDSPRHADSSGRPCWNVSRCKVQVEADPAGYK